MAEINDAVLWVGDVAVKSGLGDQTSYAMQVCVEEALTNIVRHGHCAIGPGEIGLELTVTNGGVRIEVEDDCVPFDMTAATPSRPHNDPADPEVGGWGLGLIRAFASRLAYRREGERNRLTLEFDPVPARG
jgi:anti-sigma regulatory factor (Ser/Thr protein kinase)